MFFWALRAVALGCVDAVKPQLGVDHGLIIIGVDITLYGIAINDPHDQHGIAVFGAFVTHISFG